MKRLFVATAAAALLVGCSNFALYESTQPTYSNQSTAAPGFRQGFDALRAGDYVRAEALLKDSLALRPNDPYTLLSLGVATHNLGRRAEAEGYYRAAAASGAGAPVGDTLGVDPTTGQRLDTVRKMALYNLSQYTAAPTVYQPATVTTYEPAPATYQYAPATTYETAPTVYEYAPATTYDPMPAPPVYEAVPVYN